MSPAANLNQAVDLLRQLVKDCPKVPGYRYDLGETLARLGGLGGLGGFGGPGRSWSSDHTATFLDFKKWLDEALAISTALVAEYPTMPQYVASEAQVHHKIAFVFEQMQEFDKEEKTRRKAVNLQSELAKKHPDVIAYSYSLAVMQSSLARLLARNENWIEARKLLEESTTRMEDLFTRNSRLGFMRMSLSHNYQELSQVLLHLSERDLASAALKKAEAYGPERAFGSQGRRGDFHAGERRWDR